MNLGDMLEDMMKRHNGSEASRPSPLPEAIIMELRARLEVVNSPNPFKVGDLVTPRANGYLTDAGQPCIVVAVDNDAKPVFSAERFGAASNGAICNLRVSRCDDDEDIVEYWHNHAEYVPYTGPGA